MITMQLTPADIQDGKTVIDAAVIRGDLTAAQAGTLYHSLFVAASQVGIPFQLSGFGIVEAPPAPQLPAVTAPGPYERWVLGRPGDPLGELNP